MITVNEALKNIDMVIAATSMNREQHNILAESVRVVAECCQVGSVSGRGRVTDKLEEDYEEKIEKTHKEDLEDV